MKNNPLSEILPLQPEFRPVLPTVYGNVDYRRFEQLLKRIDGLLRGSGIERWFIAQSLEVYELRAKVQKTEVKDWARDRHQAQSLRALRCEVLRKLLGEDFRGMARRLAECPLFQWFCHLDEIDRVQVPGKSTLQEFACWLSAEKMREMVNILSRAASDSVVGVADLNLANAIELETVWMDTTCVKANIHFPVDWVLLRDGVRTLMKAVALIRRHGLRHRMAEPATFLRRINVLSMEMSAVRRQADSKKHRKRVLRQMKKLVRVVAAHARRYRGVLDARWKQTDWTRKQAEQVLRRIDGVLALLPQAVHQAHERMIGGRLIPSAEKLLSLYEANLHVLVRGKAQAEVEFGNKLLLTEQCNGLIIDWQLEQDGVPADNKLLKPSLERIQQALPRILIGGVGADRGFASQDNSRLLQNGSIFDGICPKDVGEMQRRRKHLRFVLIQKRRAQTEGRIGIFQNVFLGRPLRAKGFEHRNLAVAWSVLAHNLWVLARLPTAEEKKRKLKLAA